MNVLQKVEAWLPDGAPLPTSTGQVVTETVAQDVIQANTGKALAAGYTVDADGINFTFVDYTAPNGYRVRQSYVEADPFYQQTPPHPFGGGKPPPVAAVSTPPIGAGTFRPFIWGQSLAAYIGRGRYTSKLTTGQPGTPWTWNFFNGAFYPCNDPHPGSDGIGGGVWSRMADVVWGRPFNGTAVNRVVIGNCAVGGTSISMWAPGGIFNPHLIGRITDYRDTVGQPTHLVFYQGQADWEQTTQWWIDNWFAMLNSVRQLGISCPIYTAVSANHGLRAGVPDNSVTYRAPDFYIANEVGKERIRAAQRYVGNYGPNCKAGPNTDLIDWRLRAAGDGQHMGEIGLHVEAQMWADALIP